MFAQIDNTTYVAPPDDAVAVKLLTLRRDKKLKAIHITLIVVPGSLFLFTGVVAAYWILTWARSWGVALTGIGVGLLGIIGTLVMGKAALAIAQQSQINQFKRFVSEKRILELPEIYSKTLYALLTRNNCLQFLVHYRPDPYDIGELKVIIDEINSGNSSFTYITRRLVPAITKLVKKIRQAQQAQEETHANVAKALDELPRPDNF